MNCAKVVIEVIGEGRTELGLAEITDEQNKPAPPNKGVLPILVHTLCGRPDAMLVKRRKYSSLQGKTRAQKVQFAKRQAMYNHSGGVVFVIDSDGDLKSKSQELVAGRDREHPQYPAAVGVAHPCIEAWILADVPAIYFALELSGMPAVLDDPEKLPSPSKNRTHNPKTVLRDIVGDKRNEISSKDKDEIAKAMNDVAVLRRNCPRSFAPFADEVENRIRPLF